MFNVKCEKCGAAAGQRCSTIGRTGKQKKRKAHSARIRAQRKGAGRGEGG